MVGGAFDGGRGDPGLEHAIDDAVDAVDRGARGQADGETDVGMVQTSGAAARRVRGVARASPRGTAEASAPRCRHRPGQCSRRARPARAGPLAEHRAPDADDRRALLDRRARSRRSCPSTAPGRAPASARAAALDRSRRRAERRARASAGPLDQPADRHQARGHRGARSPSSVGERRLDGQPGANPAFAGSSSTLTWTRTG